MKRISTVAVSFIFAAIFAVSAFGQAAAPAGKIGWIDTGMFADEKEGVVKYNNAIKALDTEMRPTVTSLQGLQTKIQNIAEEIRKMTSNPAVPINQHAVALKQEEGQKLQRDFEYQKKDYDARLEKRSSDILGPVSADISRAIQDYAKQKGYAVVLDIAALANNGAILALDASANITKDFITFYNARPATTATNTTPK
jgi:Skp family chaperone for outer membrane proteins